MSRSASVLGSRRPSGVEWYALVGASGAVLLAVSWRAAQTGRCGPVECAVFDSVNELPDSLDWPMWAPMQAGSLGGAAAIAAGGGLLTRSWRVAGTLWSAGFGAWLLAKVVKRFVRRGRPGDILGHEKVRPDPLTGKPHDGYGYLSGHTAVAVALGVVAGALVPRRWRGLVFVPGLLTGVARMHLGAHLPLDVAGGAGLGAVVGSGIVLVGRPWLRAR